MGEPGVAECLKDVQEFMGMMVTGDINMEVEVIGDNQVTRDQMVFKECIIFIGEHGNVDFVLLCFLERGGGGRQGQGESKICQ